MIDLLKYIYLLVVKHGLYQLLFSQYKKDMYGPHIVLLTKFSSLKISSQRLGNYHLVGLNFPTGPNAFAWEHGFPSLFPPFTQREDSSVYPAIPKKTISLVSYKISSPCFCLGY